VSATTDAELLRRGRSLEYATLGWNAVGVVVLAVAALSAGSVALAGFGLDSAVEICASVVVLWQLPTAAGAATAAAAVRVGTAEAVRERRAMRLIGSGFVVLVIYVVAQVVITVVTGGRPAPSVVGIVWTAMTCLLMLALAAGKARTGAALGSPVLTAEGRVTLIDAGLAGSVLLGLVFNATLGWWWADPLAGLVLVYYGAREARVAFAHGAAV
jgi:divalent metal cation (Fe/Co/Zn/Cd) transporter